MMEYHKKYLKYKNKYLDLKYNNKNLCLKYNNQKKYTLEGGSKLILSNLPIYLLLCGKYKYKTIEEINENRNCSIIGQKIAKSLIRNASTRIFDKPEKSVIELIVNSFDSYPQDLKSIGKFGMGFFSFLYWIINKPKRFIMIQTTSNDKSENKSYQLKIYYEPDTDITDENEKITFIKFDLVELPPISTTGTIITLNYVDDKLSSNELIDLNNAINTLKFFYRGKLINNETGIIINNNVTKMNEFEVSFSLTKDILRVEDNGSGITLDNILNSLLIPSVSTKGISQTNCNGIVSDYTNIIKTTNDFNMFYITVGGIIIFKKEFEYYEHGYDIIIDMPVQTKVPVARNDVILTKEDKDDCKRLFLLNIDKLLSSTEINVKDIKIINLMLVKNALLTYINYTPDTFLGSELYNFLINKESQLKETFTNIPFNFIDYLEKNYTILNLDTKNFIITDNLNYNSLESELIAKTLPDHKTDEIFSNKILISIYIDDDFNDFNLENVIFINQGLIDSYIDPSLTLLNKIEKIQIKQKILLNYTKTRLDLISNDENSYILENFTNNTEIKNTISSIYSELKIYDETIQGYFNIIVNKILNLLNKNIIFVSRNYFTSLKFPTFLTNDSWFSYHTTKEPFLNQWNSNMIDILVATVVRNYYNKIDLHIAGKSGNLQYKSPWKDIIREIGVLVSTFCLFEFYNYHLKVNPFFDVKKLELLVYNFNNLLNEMNIMDLNVRYGGSIEEKHIINYNSYFNSIIEGPYNYFKMNTQNRFYLIQRICKNLDEPLQRKICNFQLQYLLNENVFKPSDIYRIRDLYIKYNYEFNPFIFLFLSKKIEGNDFNYFEILKETLEISDNYQIFMFIMNIITILLNKYITFYLYKKGIISIQDLKQYYISGGAMEYNRIHLHEILNLANIEHTFNKEIDPKDIVILKDKLIATKKSDLFRLLLDTSVSYYDEYRSDLNHFLEYYYSENISRIKSTLEHDRFDNDSILENFKELCDKLKLFLVKQPDEDSIAYISNINDRIKFFMEYDIKKIWNSLDNPEENAEDIDKDLAFILQDTNKKLLEIYREVKRDEHWMSEGRFDYVNIDNNNYTWDHIAKEKIKLPLEKDIIIYRNKKIIIEELTNFWIKIFRNDYKFKREDVFDGRREISRDHKYNIEYYLLHITETDPEKLCNDVFFPKLSLNDISWLRDIELIKTKINNIYEFVNSKIKFKSIENFNNVCRTYSWKIFQNINVPIGTMDSSKGRLYSKYYNPFIYSYNNNEFKLLKEYINGFESDNIIILENLPIDKEYNFNFTLSNFISYVMENDISPEDDYDSIKTSFEGSELVPIDMQIIKIAANQGSTKNVFESVTTELLQNSFDAINENQPENKNININLSIFNHDESDSSLFLEIIDYVGIPNFHIIINLMIPYLSDKVSQPNLTGEMGNGFFNAYRFSENVWIKTIHNNNSYEIKDNLVKDGNGDVIDIDKFILYSNIEAEPVENSTSIQVLFNRKPNNLTYNDYIYLINFIKSNFFYSYSDINIYLNDDLINGRKLEALCCLKPSIYINYELYMPSLILTNGLPFTKMEDFINNNNIIPPNYLELINKGLILDLPKSMYTPTQSRTSVKFNSEKDIVHIRLNLLKGIYEFYIHKYRNEDTSILQYISHYDSEINIQDALTQLVPDLSWFVSTFIDKLQELLNTGKTRLTLHKFFMYFKNNEKNIAEYINIHINKFTFEEIDGYSKEDEYKTSIKKMIEETEIIQEKIALNWILKKIKRKDKYRKTTIDTSTIFNIKLNKKDDFLQKIRNLEKTILSNPALKESIEEQIEKYKLELHKIENPSSLRELKLADRIMVLDKIKLIFTFYIETYFTLLISNPDYELKTKILPNVSINKRTDNILGSYSYYSNTINVYLEMDQIMQLLDMLLHNKKDDEIILRILYGNFKEIYNKYFNGNIQPVGVILHELEHFRRGNGHTSSDAHAEINDESFDKVCFNIFTELQKQNFINIFLEKISSLANEKLSTIFNDLLDILENNNKYNLLD